MAVILGTILFLSYLSNAAEPNPYEGNLYISGNLNLLDVSRFEKNALDEWQYTNDEALIGIGIHQGIGKMHYASLETQLMLNFSKHNLTGIRIGFKIGNPSLDVVYTFRNYFTNDVNAYYALGQESIHTLALNLHSWFLRW